MEIRHLSLQDYKQIFQDPYHVFNTADFNSLNSTSRGIDVEYLAFKTKKFKLGLIAGKVDNKFRSPFSAPFGGFSFLKNEVGLEILDQAVDLLIDYCNSSSIISIELTLPPFFYDENFTSKINNVLFRKNFSNVKCDLNYSIHLKEDINRYLETLQYNAKKNLKIALSKTFHFHKLTTHQGKFNAYEIIRRNREARGFPLRMTFEVIENTIKLIEADFFIVKLNEVDVASAIVFHVAIGIVQVIYWGDLPEYASEKTMNFLSYEIVSHYFEKGIKIIDIGPSTEDSIPNYGLCDFKESIGCNIYPKLTWKYEF